MIRDNGLGAKQTTVKGSQKLMAELPSQSVRHRYPCGKSGISRNKTVECRPGLRGLRSSRRPPRRRRVIRLSALGDSCWRARSLTGTPRSGLTANRHGSSVTTDKQRTKKKCRSSVTVNTTLRSTRSSETTHKHHTENTLFISHNRKYRTVKYTTHTSNRLKRL